MRLPDRSCKRFSEQKVGSVLPLVPPIQQSDSMAGVREGRLSPYSHIPA